MLKLKSINLIRTSNYYRHESLKSFVIQSLLAPVKTLTTKPTTEFFLKDINLSIEAGERVALIGKNGSGKSTLCRLLAEQVFATSGEYLVEHHVKLFSQLENSFFRELTGRENLRYFIQFIYRQLERSEQIELTKKAEEFSELGLALDRMLETYSTGMISRLALSLILAKEHDLLILDEMQNHADANFREKVARQLTQVINSSKIVIIVSHNEEDIRAICKRGVVIDDGKIVFDGNIEKALAFYKVQNLKAANA